MYLDDDAQVVRVFSFRLDQLINDSLTFVLSLFFVCHSGNVEARRLSYKSQSDQWSELNESQ